MASERKRLLQILADGAPGGGSTAVLGLAEDLQASGDYDVTVITAPGSATLERALRLGLPAQPFDFFTSRFDLRIPSRLAPIIAGIRPDLIHVHGGRSAYPFTSKLLSRPGAPLVYTVHGFHFTRRPNPFRSLARLAERRIARRADAIVFVSAADRSIALANGFIAADSRKDTVIPNGIDPGDFMDLKPLERTWDLLFLGRLHPQKNPLFLIDIMAKLKPHGLTLLVVAGGALEEAMRAAAEAAGVGNAITFAGALPRHEGLRALLSAKVFILPSLWEGLPIAPIEALYCRLPVVASDISGTDEVVTDGESGFLIRDFDPRLYAGAILKLVSDAPLRRAFGEAGRAIVEAKFLRSRNSAAHMQLYSRLLTNP